MNASLSTIGRALAAAILAIVLGAANDEHEQGVPGLRDGGFAARGGEAVFRSICQGCHMPDAKGATGAGSYPALAADANLEAAAFPIVMVVQGRKAMPAFGPMLTDQQIADVVNYIRTHFGNRYADTVNPDDVKEIRAISGG